MEFYVTSEGKLGLKSIPPVLADILRQIPFCGDRESDEVESRLFPMPSVDPGEEDFREDWKAYVQPDLHQLFQSARQTVESDLRGLKEEGEFFELEFPFNHAEAWLNALNQARLALAAEHNFGEKDLSSFGPTVVANERDFALLQIELYADLQHWLIEVLNEGIPE
jgi:Domain of unknown function (DUF2017)